VDDAELSELGRAALGYLGLGLAVIPIVARDKRPASAHGVNDWTDNPDQVRLWWSEHPTDNVGIVCGTPSRGLLVIDLDVSDEKDGLATLKEWETAHGELPETAEEITGGGGRHLLYRTGRTNIHPSTNRALGVDVRADGSYIVAAPSVHPSGERYEWWAAPDDVGIADATDDVYDFVDYVQRNGGTDDALKDRQDGGFTLPDEIKEGERDDTLFRYGSRLRRFGRNDAEILNELTGVNLLRCKPPMSMEDVRRIAKSCCRYERGSESSDVEVGAPHKQASSVASQAEDGEIPNFRGKGGTIKHNILAKILIDENLARRIDGAPAIWTGDRWDFGLDAIERVAIRYADDIKSTTRSEVVKYIQVNSPSVLSDKDFDGRYYIQFKNGTFDVLTQEMVEPNPEMFVFAELPVEFDPDEQPNLADEFLASIAGGDETVVTALCETIGACMTSRRVLSQSPMLIGRAGGAGGEASNGKSTFLKAITALLGQDNVSSLDIATLGQRFQAAHILGKLANLGDDIPTGRLESVELSNFKKSVTGDSIYTDVKGGRGFNFRPAATMVFSTNEVPRLGDTTEGVFRRLSFIPFRVSFTPDKEGYDPNITYKLTAPDVLRRFAVLGCIALPDLIDRGRIIRIPDMDEEIRSIRLDNDSVLRWVDEMSIGIESLRKKPIASAYAEYEDWCRASGERFPCSNRTFAKRVKIIPEFVDAGIKTDTSNHVKCFAFDMFP
jgi:P4 family phage/plasmid primase-like protien